MCMLQETFLKSKHTHDMNRYKLFRTDRGDYEAGGTAIAVRRDIEALVIPVAQLAGLVALEATAVMIKLGNGHKLFCISTYNRDNNRRIVGDLLKVFEKLCLQRFEHEYVFGGDYNAAHVQWGYGATRTRGRELVDFVEQTRPSFGCRIMASRAPSRPTSGTFPDLFLVKDTVNVRPIADDEVNALPSLSLGFSDHKMILLACSGVESELSTAHLAEGRFGRLRRGVSKISKDQFWRALHGNCGHYGLGVYDMRDWATKRNWIC